MSRTTFRSQVLVRSVAGTPNSPLSLPAREEVTPNNPVPFRPGKRLLQTIDCLFLEARGGGASFLTPDTQIRAGRAWQRRGLTNLPRRRYPLGLFILRGDFEACAAISLTRRAS